MRATLGEVIDLPGDIARREATAPILGRSSEIENVRTLVVATLLEANL